ncbi:hypothetical protein M231_02681 [Tremella mesenterica]|uniref:GH16 domain-containing protein n=1 Tax=Tremella mesenterica TaxID=5217 RepID=A0A4Q1BQ37_TREME|nr:hypothetical protein M231_02681 [Tremella mesenterica]
MGDSSSPSRQTIPQSSTTVNIGQTSAGNPSISSSDTAELPIAETSTASSDPSPTNMPSRQSPPDSNQGRSRRGSQWSNPTPTSGASFSHNRLNSERRPSGESSNMRINIDVASSLHPSRRPSTYKGHRPGLSSDSVRAEFSPRIVAPVRPLLSSSNSATALLNDASGDNTPTVLTPEGDGSNPFHDFHPTLLPSLPTTPTTPTANSDGKPAPPHTSTSTEGSFHKHVEREETIVLAAPPKIRINSLPDSPASGDIPSFDSPAPIPTITSSFHPSPTSPHIPASSPFSKENGRVVGGILNREGSGNGVTTAVENKTTIVDRRKERLKTFRNKDLKPRGGVGHGHGHGNGNGHGHGVGNGFGGVTNRKPFQSTRLKGEIYKPWLEKTDPAQRWARWITLTSIFIGLAVAGILCWDGYASVPSVGKLCLVLNDDFSNGIDPSLWTHEVRLDGYDHGEFEWTTSSSNNSFTQDGILYLVPTLTSDQLGVEAITNGYTLNLTADGTCTSTNVSQCVAISNSSRLTVINPVQSARLTTRNSVSLKYGKVEVKARFPTGDWLWPSITLLPVNETYGAWPRSGQIDILTARGNNASYPNRGVDYAQSDLHWGPDTDLDRLYLTWGYREQRRTYYNQKWHTFGLEWNDKFMWTYIDSRVSQVISLRFNKESFWKRGNFPSTITNTTTGDVQKLINPWIQSENKVAPFDQPFYLVLSLGVGGTDGWFPDGEGGKPWLDDSGTSMSDFWLAKGKWWAQNWSSDPTVRGFGIDSVKMWQVC